MTPEQFEYAQLKTLEIATTAAQLAAAVADILHQQSALAPSHAQHLSVLSLHLGELFQEAGDDEIASDFGAIAARLVQPR